MRLKHTSAFLFAAQLAVVSCSNEQPKIQVPASPLGMVDFIQSPEFKKATVADDNLALDSLGKYLSKAREPGITLSGVNSYTMLTPSNKAIDVFLSQLSGSTIGFYFINGLGDLNADLLTRLLSYHIFPGRHAQGSLGAAESSITLLGERLMVYRSGTHLSFEGTRVAPFSGMASIVIADRNAANGVVHVIDQVLTPPSMGESLMASAKTVAAPARFAAPFSIMAALIDKADAAFTEENAEKFEYKVATILTLSPDKLAAYTEKLPHGIEPGLTVFLIPNVAVEGILGGRKAFLDQFDAKQARDFLLNHVAFGKYPATKLTEGIQLLTFSGGLNASANNLTYLDVKVEQPAGRMDEEITVKSLRSTAEPAPIKTEDAYTFPNGVAHVITASLPLD